MRGLLFPVTVVLALSGQVWGAVAYHIEVRQVPEVSVAYMVGKASSEEEIHVEVPRIFKTVKSYLREQGALAEARPPFIRFLKYDIGKEIIVEAGWPISKPFKATDEIKLGQLAAGKVAMTVHVGKYVDLVHANDAIRTWLKENGKIPAGPHWNRITNNPLEVPKNEIRTEVYYPIH